MKRRGILAAGNWMVDHLKTIDRWPAEGELCRIVAEEQCGGGGPCNLLHDLAALGIDLPLFAAGLLGEDAGGEYLLESLRRHRIDTRYMRRTRRVPTSYTDVMTGNGKRTFFCNNGANALLDVEDLAIPSLPLKIFYLGYLLLLDKLDAADPEFGTRGARVLHGMREAGLITAVDLVSDAGERFLAVVPPALPHTDILVINEIEAGHLLGKSLRRPDGRLCADRLPDAGDKLLNLGVRQLAVIHFPEGSYAAAANGERRYNPSCRMERREIVGTNGAGDAFFAGLLYGLHEELSLDDALKFAAAAARFNLRNASATGGAPTLAMLTGYLDNCQYEEIPEFFR